jgi:heat shock protein HtpX
VRGYALRSAAPVAGLATVVIVIGAGCAGLGAAVAGAGGAVIGVLIAAALTATACAYCDRMALSAMLARPVSEVEHPELYRLVRELSKEGRLPVPRLYLSPAEQPNSFAVGRGPRTAAVCCTEGLLRILDEAELRGVLGHELAHVSGRDILASSVSAGLATIITFPAAIARLLPGSRSPGVLASPAPASPAPQAGTAAASGPSRPPGASASSRSPGASASSALQTGAVGVGPGAVEALLLLVFGPIAALVVRLATTQAREYRADAAGALLAGDPVALSSALRKIDFRAAQLPLAPDGRLLPVGHLMIASPFRAQGIARLFLTHPPAGERVRRLEALAGYRR